MTILLSEAFAAYIFQDIKRRIKFKTVSSRLPPFPRNHLSPSKRKVIGRQCGCIADNSCLDIDFLFIRHCLLLSFYVLYCIKFIALIDNQLVHHAPRSLVGSRGSSFQPCNVPRRIKGFGFFSLSLESSGCLESLVPSKPSKPTLNSN